MTTDFSSAFANRFETAMSEQSQPATELVNARLQRIEELERIRQERLAAHTPVNAGTAAARLERRERLIRQSTTRSTERRGFAPNVQRTPVHRSQSFETTSSVINEETLNFCEAFESTRQNLFSTRAAASTDNLTSLFNRRTPEVPLSSSRSNLTQEPDSSSNTRSRPALDLATGIAEAFSSVRAGLGLGLESNLASRDTTRAVLSATRESRSPSTNFQRFVMSNPSPDTGSPLTRSASVRETRRESRFRRRTIQGVDTNVSEALERDQTAVETRAAVRSSSVTRLQMTRSSSQTSLSATQTVQNKGDTTLTAQMPASSSTTSSYASSAYSAHSYNGRGRPVEICPEESAPVLGLENEKVIFVDDKGHCHWLNKHHQLVRSLKNSNMVPEIVVKDKLKEESSKENESYVATLDNDANKRYEKLRELVLLAHLKDSKAEKQNCDETDSLLSDVQNLTLVELCQRNDLVERLNKTSNGVIDIDNKYKSFSLYTHPRPKPDMEEYLSTREVVPLYDGIDMSVFESSDGSSESQAQQGSQNRFGPRSPLVYELSSSRFASSHRSSSSVTSSNGTVTRTQENRSDNQQERFSYTRSHDGVESETISYMNSENSSFSQFSSTMTDAAADENPRSTARVRFYEPEPIQDNSEVNLVLERLHVMQGAMGQTIDTSHLDYEEMLMIQKALEENPSPPESPQSSPEIHDSPEISYFPQLTETPTISRHQVTTDVPEQTAVIPRRILPTNTQSETSASRRPYGSFTRQMRQNTQGATSRTVTTSGRSQLVEQSLTQAADQSFVASYSDSNNTSQLSVTMSEIQHNTESEASGLSEPQDCLFTERRSLTRGNETTASTVSSNGSLNTQSQSTSSSTVISEQRARLGGFIPRLQRISSSGSETSPRLQRPSSSDSLLPLPSMDFTQIQRSHADSTAFNFSQASVSQASATNTVSNVNKSKPEVSVASNSRSIRGTSVDSQLSIEIPESSAASPTHATRRGSCGTPKSATSPLVKSQSTSRSGSEAPSPAGSDTVTAVFEEFVQAIPSSLLANWSLGYGEHR